MGDLFWGEWGAKEKRCAKESYPRPTAAARYATKKREASREPNVRAGSDSKEKCVFE